MVFFLACVLAAAWIAHGVVARAVHQSADAQHTRRATAATLNRLADALWTTETSLQRYMVDPTGPGRKETLTALRDVDARIGELAQHSWPATPDPAPPERLHRLAATLEREVVRVMDIRTDADRLYPALRELIDQTLPASENFRDQATLALSDAEEHRSEPGQDQARRLFSEARYQHAALIGTFRTYLMSRLGMFRGSFEKNAQAQQQNVVFYLQAIYRLLEELAQLERGATLSLVQEEALDQMRRSLRTWQSHFERADTIYTSDAWRSDIPVLRDVIGPKFRELWDAAEAVRQGLDQSSANELANVASIGDRLSDTLWLIGLLALFVTGAGYVLFELTVRRPVRDVALALKAEALGGTAPVLAPSNLQETRDLIEAFGYMRQEVHTRQQRLEAILEAAAEGILIFDAAGNIESHNPALAGIFRWSPEHPCPASLPALLDRDHAEQNAYHQALLACAFDSLSGQTGELLARRADGTTFPISLKIRPMELPGWRLYTALVDDISERQALMQHLRALAEHDDLTGLFNRNYFMQELDRVVERARRDQEIGVLLYLDLDNFKYVNDTLGHLAGDALIAEVARLLRGRARSGDVVARLGDDEFTVLLYHATADETPALAESYRRALAEFRFRHSGEDIEIGCSVGAAVIDIHCGSAQEVLAHADFACHMAKRHGRNRVHIFAERDQPNVAAMSVDMGWFRRLKEAIEHDAFALAAQPIASTRHGQTSFYEILLRLRESDGSLTLPSGFLPVAERFGLAAEIDRWVIRHTIKILAQRHRTNRQWRYAVNLSAQSLQDPQLAGWIIDTLRTAELDPRALSFEITESSAIAELDIASECLSQLQAIGCTTALDDFGTGMSSFAYLRELPVDYVKIDGRFVRQARTNLMDQALVRAMTDIAHALGKRVVAEFVEDEPTLRLLAGFGVDYVQGYHVGKPVLLDDGPPAAERRPGASRTG